MRFAAVAAPGQLRWLCAERGEAADGFQGFALVRSCCGFAFFSSAAMTVDPIPIVNVIATITASTVLMCFPAVRWKTDVILSDR